MSTRAPSLCLSARRAGRSHLRARKQRRRRAERSARLRQGPPKKTKISWRDEGKHSYRIRTSEVEAVGAGERDLHEVRVLEVAVPRQVVHDRRPRRARPGRPWRRGHLGAPAPATAAWPAPLSPCCPPPQPPCLYQTGRARAGALASEVVES
jgi:hypothetical protein